VQTPKFPESEAPEAREPEHPCPPGKWRGTVLETIQSICAGGEDTLHVMIGITGPDGTEYRLVDALPATSTLKLLHFARACGCEDKYRAGHIEPAMCLGREVIAIVQIEHQKNVLPRAVIFDYARVASAVVTPLRTAGES
jgi:hypothetical protein